MHDADGLLKRLFASAFFMEAGLWLVLVAVAVKILDLGGDALALSAAPALGGASYLLLAPLARSLGARYGPFRVIRYGNLALVLFATLAFQAPSLPRLLLILPLLSFAATLYWPQARRVLSAIAVPESEAPARRRSFSLAWSAGQCLGVLAGGLVLSHYEFRSTFLAGIGLAALSFFSLPRDPEPLEEEALLRADSRETARNRVAALLGLGAGALLLQTPLLLAGRGWNAARFGVFLAIVFLAQTLVLALRWAPSARGIASLALLLAGLAFIALPWMGSYAGLMALALAVGAALGLRLQAVEGNWSSGAVPGLDRPAKLLILSLFTVAGGLLARASGWDGAPFPFGGILLVLAAFFARNDREETDPRRSNP